MRTYLDAQVTIYLVEQIPHFETLVVQWLANHPYDMFSSGLCRMESLIHPVRHGDHKLIADFEKFFRQTAKGMARLNRKVYNRAIQIRASRPSFRTPDALHLALAMNSGCDVFLTNDKRLKIFTGIRVEVI